MCFNRGANMRFHFACSPVIGHLLPERVKDVETFHLTRIIRQFVVYFCPHRGKCAGKDDTLAITNAPRIAASVSAAFIRSFWLLVSNYEKSCDQESRPDKCPHERRLSRRNTATRKKKNANH